MIHAIIAWAIAFCVNAAFARVAAWNIAFQLTMPFPQFDADAIYGQIKDRVLNRTWLICAIIGSTLVASGFLVNAEYDDNDAIEIVEILLATSGVILIGVQIAVRSFSLFRTALSEMGLPWPPSASEQKP